jgi:ubiquinone/menaquinone biosynthesis C-methylase UbiE
VRIFERGWLVNLILLGNYARLRDTALQEIGDQADGNTLQVACVYGDLTNRLSARIAPGGTLTIIDVLAIQLRNLRRKLPSTARVLLLQRDSTALRFPDASHDRALVFFLLHEQPATVRRRTLEEIVRVVKPGGKIILVDYHRPHRWHPLRHPIASALRRLEPYALDLWRADLREFLPKGIPLAGIRKETYFGGMYQKVVLTR